MQFEPIRLQLHKANGAHDPDYEEPDEAYGGNNGARHGDILSLGRLKRRAHALWWVVQIAA
jgi:hypothetical protein